MSETTAYYGSDNVFGYQCLVGGSPVEAASISVTIEQDDHTVIQGPDTPQWHPDTEEYLITMDLAHSTISRWPQQLVAFWTWSWVDEHGITQTFADRQYIWFTVPGVDAFRNVDVWATRLTQIRYCLNEPVESVYKNDLLREFANDAVFLISGELGIPAPRQIASNTEHIELPGYALPAMDAYVISKAFATVHDYDAVAKWESDFRESLARASLMAMQVRNQEAETTEVW